MGSDGIGGLDWFGDDCLAYHGRRISRIRLLGSLLTSPGLQAVALIRLAGTVGSVFGAPAGRFVLALCHLVTGADVAWGAQLGSGLVMRHPTGVVIGKGAVVGTRCTILQGVTLGERSGDGSGVPGYPRVGSGVVLSAHAAVLGPIRVGDRSTVGANAVVVADVPADSTAVGVPARILSGNGNTEDGLGSRTLGTEVSPGA